MRFHFGPFIFGKNSLTAGSGSSTVFRSSRTCCLQLCRVCCNSKTCWWLQWCQVSCHPYQIEQLYDVALVALSYCQRRAPIVSCICRIISSLSTSCVGQSSLRSAIRGDSMYFKSFSVICSSWLAPFVMHGNYGLIVSMSCWWWLSQTT